jgi:hypothetical protein
MQLDYSRNRGAGVKGRKTDVSEILSLPCVDIDYLCDLPDERGIYFVFGLERIIYIGQAEDFRDRWYRRKHHRLDQIRRLGTGTRIYWLATAGNVDLSAVEREMIGLFNPLLNDSMVEAGPVLEPLPHKLQALVPCRYMGKRTTQGINPAAWEQPSIYGPMGDWILKTLEKALLDFNTSRQDSDRWIIADQAFFAKNSVTEPQKYAFWEAANHLEADGWIEIDLEARRLSFAQLSEVA